MFSDVVKVPYWTYHRLYWAGLVMRYFVLLFYCTWLVFSPYMLWSCITCGPLCGPYTHLKGYFFMRKRTIYLPAISRKYMLTVKFEAKVLYWAVPMRPRFPDPPFLEHTILRSKFPPGVRTQDPNILMSDALTT